MGNLIQKLLNNPIPISILGASIILGSFYYVSESKKQRRAEELQQEKEEKANFLLSNCIGLAEEADIEQRYDTCKALGSLKGACLQIKDMSLGAYAREKGTDEFSAAGDWGKYSLGVLNRKKICECSLPVVISDRLSGVLKDRKNECYQKFPPS